MSRCSLQQRFTAILAIAVALLWPFQLHCMPGTGLPQPPLHHGMAVMADASSTVHCPNCKDSVQLTRAEACDTTQSPLASTVAGKLEQGKLSVLPLAQWLVLQPLEFPHVAVCARPPGGPPPVSTPYPGVAVHDAFLRFLE